MAKNGVDEETIKLCGRWISDSYLMTVISTLDRYPVQFASEGQE
jgi:hypothetical protein